MKIGQFSRPATPFVQLRPKFFYSSNPLTLDVHFQTNKQTPPPPLPLKIITNQLKEKII